MRKRRQQTAITDPAALAAYPRLDPPKTRQTDMISLGVERSLTLYEDEPGNPRAGHGAAVVCNVCGTVLRTGQPHSSLRPEPHQSLDMLTVRAPLEDGPTSTATRELYHTPPRKSHAAKIRTRPLVQGEDGLWREATE